VRCYHDNYTTYKLYLDVILIKLQGVLEEVGLIQWPTVSGALLNTLLVIGIVLGTSLVLLAVNTGLAELSRDIYSKL
jgi:hypothetical protein